MLNFGWINIYWYWFVGVFGFCWWGGCGVWIFIRGFYWFVFFVRFFLYFCVIFCLFFLWLYKEMLWWGNFFFCCFIFVLFLVFIWELIEDCYYYFIFEFLLVVNFNINLIILERMIFFFVVKIGLCFMVVILVFRNVLCRYWYVGICVKLDVLGLRFYVLFCWNVYWMFFWVWCFWLIYYLVFGIFLGVSMIRFMVFFVNI